MEEKQNSQTSQDFDSFSNPSDEIEASKEPANIHELMYRLATQNHQLWMGGSENASRL